MGATINDVARLAGVSKSTVSKVMNGWTTISPATVDRVNKAISELHYTPNSRAVSFAKGSSKNIVYLTNLSKNSPYQNPHMYDIMCGVHKIVSDRNFTLTLVDTSTETYPGERAHHEITRGSADGIIIHGSSVNAVLAKELVDASFPHIVIGSSDHSDSLCWVDTNHKLEGEYAAMHMQDCNYTDVVFVTGHSKSGIANDRLDGFRKRMLNQGTHIPNENIWHTDANPDCCYNVTSNELKRHASQHDGHYPQAIICENSATASSIIKAIHDTGLSIPEDIAFLGFDQYPYVNMVYPTPTIINVDVFDLGVQAAENIIRKMDNPNLLIQTYTTLPVLMQGASTIPKCNT